MSTRTPIDPSALWDDRLPTAIAIPIAALLLLPVWIQILGSAVNEFGGPLLAFTHSHVGTVSVLFVFIATFFGLYLTVRPVDAFLRLPDRAGLRALGTGVLLLPVLVAIAALVARSQGVYFVTISEAPFPVLGSVDLWLVGTVGWLAIGVLTAVGAFHVVLQSEFRATTTPSLAVAVTTAAGGSLFAVHGLSFGVLGPYGYPVAAEYLALLAAIAAIAIAVVGYDRAQRDWQRYAALVPLAVVAVGTALQFLGVVDNGAFLGSPFTWSVPGVATAVFALSQITVVGVAAYTYERTRSILAPVLIYATVYLAAAVAVLFVDVGSAF